MVTSGSEYSVIVGTSTWELGGVNTISLTLLRALSQLGIEGSLLITEPFTNRLTPMPYPGDIGVAYLPVRWHDSWRRHHRALKRYLEDRAPCIYLPTCDWKHALVCPALPNDIAVVGVLHSDEPVYYEQASRLGPYWNAIVCVSEAIRERLVRERPEFSERTHVIPNCVDVPPNPPPRAPGSERLSIVFTGRITRQQKRVFDLLAIARILSQRGIPFHMTVVGDGPDYALFQAAAQPFKAQGLLSVVGLKTLEQVREILRRNDVFLLVSDFEGMPMSLIEAMAEGCAPVVSRIDSGIPELIRDGENGYVIPGGDIQGFADALTVLSRRPELRQAFGTAAHATVATSRFSTVAFAEAYAELFAQVRQDIDSGRFRRPPQTEPIPRLLLPPWARCLPPRIRLAARRLQKRLHQPW